MTSFDARTVTPWQGLSAQLTDGEGGRTGGWSDQPKVILVGRLFAARPGGQRWAGNGRWLTLWESSEVLFPLSVNLPVADITTGEGVGINVHNLLLQKGLMLSSASRLTPDSWLLKLFTISFISNSQRILWGNSGILCPKWPSWVKAKVGCSIHCNHQFSF